VRQGKHDPRVEPAQTAGTEVLRDQHERRLAERLALLLAAEFRRWVEEQAKN
jgi:hypothetical protein